MIIQQLENSVDFLQVKFFLYSELDGFKISILRSGAADNEYLNFIQENRKVGKISDFYHKNYSEMKEVVKTKLKDLGFEKFNFADELKESFS